MSTDHTLRKDKKDSFLRFIASGLVFTILGPGLFWLGYPLGPFIALAIAETTVHIARLMAFKMIVFPAHKGYRVNLGRYVTTALPVSLTGLAIVATLRNKVDRNSLTLIGSIVSMSIGFVWNRFIYSLPRKRLNGSCDID